MELGKPDGKKALFYVLSNKKSLTGHFSILMHDNKVSNSISFGLFHDFFQWYAFSCQNFSIRNTLLEFETKFECLLQIKKLNQPVEQVFKMKKKLVQKFSFLKEAAP